MNRRTFLAGSLGGSVIRLSTSFQGRGIWVYSVLYNHFGRKPDDLAVARWGSPARPRALTRLGTKFRIQTGCSAY